MRRNRGGFAAAFALSLALAAPIADAQKSGGVLIISHFDSPASMSLHEEATGGQPADDGRLQQSGQVSADVAQNEPEPRPARWSSSTLGVLLLCGSPLSIVPPQRGYARPHPGVAPHLILPGWGM